MMQMPDMESTKTVRNVLRRAMGNSTLAGGLTSLVLLFSSSVLAFIMFALAARQMDPHSFGSLVVIFNTMSFFAVAVVFGQETLISRSWGEYCGTDRPALARGALRFGSSISFAGGLIAALLCLLLWLQFGSYESAWIPAAASLFLFADALLTFFSRFALVAGNVVLALLPRDIPWRLAVIAVILYCAFSGMTLEVATFFFVAAAAIGLSLLYQGWRVWRLVPQAVKDAAPRYDIANWRHRSFRMWLSSLLDASSQYLEVVVVGFALGPAAAAFYFSATRITNVFSMIAGAMTTYAARHISPLYHGQTTEDLQAFLRILAIFSAFLAVGAFVTILVAGQLLLSFFGPSYTEVYPALLVLALGSSLTALAGPAPYLLLLTGHERLYPWLMALTLALRFSLIVVLSYWFGLLGAAIGGSIGAAALAIALVVASRRATGIDPSILSVIGRDKGPVFPGPAALQRRDKC